jgi:serine/threonine protein kinase
LQERVVGSAERETDGRAASTQGRRIKVASMSVTDKPGPADGEQADLLLAIARTGIIPEREYRAVRDKVKAGEYPQDPQALVERLVQDEILTRYQADRILQGKVRGLLVDRYVILDRLGEGGMGRVYKAQHRLMGRLVALKVIAPRYAARMRSVARFQREIKLIGRLDHPNIIRAYDADQIGSAFYFVMEYAGGETLGGVLEKRGPLPLDEVIDYARQAALGLAHAHGQGIVHRDIKPSNLLLTDARQIKVLDLGLGTLTDANEKTSFATVAGRAVGTIDFMSPEQANGDPVDGRSDLFGLGCTMYVLLTSRAPYPGDTDLERLVGRLKGPPIPITDHRPDLPSAAVQVLKKLMAQQPKDRFPTAAEAAEALEALLKNGLTCSIDDPPAPRPPEPATTVSAPAATLEEHTESISWPTPAVLSSEGRNPSVASSAEGMDQAPVDPSKTLGAPSRRVIRAVAILALLVAVFAAGFAVGRL